MSDIKKYFDRKTSRNYKVLGYFGGSASINFARFKEAATTFSKEVRCDLDSVCIEEIQRSRRFRLFKFLFSNEKAQHPADGYEEIDDLFNWLYD